MQLQVKFQEKNNAYKNFFLSILSISKTFLYQYNNAKRFTLTVCISDADVR